MGVKNPRYLILFLQANEEDEGRGDMLLDNSNGARFRLFYSTCIDFVILYSLIIILTKRASWCSGGRAGM